MSEDKRMTLEYRPRLRANRKSKITRKDNLLIVACDSPDEAHRIEQLIVYALKPTQGPIPDAECVVVESEKSNGD